MALGILIRRVEGRLPLDFRSGADEDNLSPMNIAADNGQLVCPETKLRLRECPLAEAEAVISSGAPLVGSRAGGVATFGRTSRVLLREDGECAYPVVEGIPVLLVPERLVAPSAQREIDLSDARYAEAYAEMQYYNAVASQEKVAAQTAVLPPDIARLLTIPALERRSFPDPRNLWIDAVYDSIAQWEAYRHLGPIESAHVLQLGGKGTHAVKFLLAGADEAWVLSPMLEEAAFSRELARQAGVEDRLRCVVGIAEELPFGSATFDAMYSGGCVHHMVSDIAFAECARVLRPGGQLAAVEPWRAPFYGVGTAIFGKREVDVHCRPLTRTRVEPLFHAFGKAEVIHHGTLSRYPLLAASKLGLRLGLSTVWNITRTDDALCSLLPGLRGLGSSITLLGTKTGSS